jgi:hypothetical protein
MRMDGMIGRREEPCEGPSESAELRFEFEPMGRLNFMARLSASSALDLLPLTAILICAVSPALTLWEVHLAGMPSWLPLSAILIQVCGVVTVVKCWRTR